MNQQVQVISLPSESRESDTKWWIFRSVYVWDTVNPPKKRVVITIPFGYLTSLWKPWPIYRWEKWWFTYWTWWFSMATLNNQRVYNDRLYGVSRFVLRLPSLTSEAFALGCCSRRGHVGRVGARPWAKWAKIMPSGPSVWPHVFLCFMFQLLTEGHGWFRKLTSACFLILRCTHRIIRFI